MRANSKTWGNNRRVVVYRRAMCAAAPPPGAGGGNWWSPELTAALDELRALRLTLAAEAEARRELERRLEVVTGERDGARALLAARGPR